MHKNVWFFYFFIWGTLLRVGAQAKLPTPERLAFHNERREAFREQLPPNSVAVLFANPIRNRANDVDYVYHQDPNFYYLTGWPEPHAVLVLYAEDQKDEQGTYTAHMYVQERDARAEQWNGYRLGIDGAKAMGFSRVSLREAFVNNPPNFEGFDKVLILDFQNDERDRAADPYDLYGLKETLKAQIDFPADFNRQYYRIQRRIAEATPENFARTQDYIRWQVERDPSLASDTLINDFLALETLELPADVTDKTATILQEYRFDVEALPRILGDLREVKTPYELTMLRRAIEISAIGQVEVMKALKPGMSEREVQGIHEYVFKKYGAAYEGYPSIVGAGNNGCVLHYIENQDMPQASDLILMDLGAEYWGYTADVTRTLPVSGKFTPEQRAIYQLVYDAQEAGIARAEVGATSSEITRATQAVIKAGLVRLGIIASEDEFRRYYPHGAVHHIGLDVHDLSNYGPLPSNSVITVEPGIYIPENSPCDPKWWGIGIRIEDDILITEKGPENLSAMAPRQWEAIEAMMEQPSALDGFVLPALRN